MRTKVLLGGAIALTTIAVALGVASPASAETGVPATDKCEITSEQRRINIVMLLDASRSLNRTDPTNARQGGLEAAVVNLANLARNNPEVDISIAVDTFSTGYTRHHGWQDAEQIQQALSGRYHSVTALPAGVAGSFTDYREAMQGLAERFRDAPPSGCNLLLWFTDGEHATEGTSSDVSESEWEQLRTLCAAERMAVLDAKGVYSIGVLLSSSGAPINAGPLNHVFGEGTSTCRHALDGEIRDQVEASSLRDVLDELINEVVYEVETEAETEDDLPRERDELPDEDEYEPCSGGDGTPELPCEYSFSLSPEIESFRVFLDMTFLGTEIKNPSAVNIRLRSPSRKGSEPVLSTAQLADAAVAQYQPVRPFWFLSRRPYDSRWEIIGHQAAEQLANEDDWEWAGEWSLLFWGDTPQAAEDAAKVAAHFRSITIDAPATIPRLNDEGKLTGFIENFPEDYKSVELYLELRDAVGPVYPTRPRLSCQSTSCAPLPVSDPGRRFELPSLLEEVVWYDSEQAGGDGLQLKAASQERPPLSVVAVLDQEFLYGGTNGYGSGGESGQPLEWSREIGMTRLTGLDALLTGKDQWQELTDWVDSGSPQALPFDLRLLPPPYGVREGTATFRVEVTPGYFPGVITLEDVRARHGGANPASTGYSEHWSCEVPGTRGQPGAQPTPCRAVRVDLNLSEDSEVTVSLDFRIAPAADLEVFARSEEMIVPSEEAWNGLWAKIERAATPRRQSLESETFRVDIATPADRFSEFLPILVFLMALALALRVLVAWRLRPWRGLHRPEIVNKGLPADSEYHLLSSYTQESLCMDLATRAVKCDLGGVTVRSRWQPLLLGRPPKLVARSHRKECLGSEGYHLRRKGESVGIIGSDLQDGWLLEIVEDEPEDRLVIWDIPAAEPERAERLSTAEEAAIDKSQEYYRDRAAEQRQPDAPAADDGENPTLDPFGDPRDPFGDDPRDPFE